MSVQHLQDPHPLDHAFVDAAKQLQIKGNDDFNGATQEGVGIYQVTQSDGQRESSATAFLKGAKRRPNLHVLTGLTVRRVLCEDRRATGVTVADANGTPRNLAASAEVILCAGTIGSPEILLRSGCGPADELRGLGIEVQADLPGARRNLHDHVDCMVICASKSNASYGLSLGALPRLARDLVLLTQGVALARKILRQAPFAPHGLTEILPGDDRPDSDFEDFVRHHARTVYHPVGTGAMGTGPQAVTDADPRVHSLRGSRVVDASIMPAIVSGNTNAPTIMIAEKAADMIRADRTARGKAA